MIASYNHFFFALFWCVDLLKYQPTHQKCLKNYATTGIQLLHGLFSHHYNNIITSLLRIIALFITTLILHYYFTSLHSPLFCVNTNSLLGIIESILHHFEIIITSLSHHGRIMVPSLLPCYYIVIMWHYNLYYYTSLLHHYYIIIPSLSCCVTFSITTLYYVITSYYYIDYYHISFQNHYYVLLHLYYAIITQLHDYHARGIITKAKSCDPIITCHGYAESTLPLSHYDYDLSLRHY